MAIIISQEPSSFSPIHATKEPIIINARGTEYILTAPVVPRLIFTFNTFPSIGNTFTWNDGSEGGDITFIATGATRSPGIECFVPSSGQTMVDWVNNVFVPVLREIPNFENYQISVGGPSSTITLTGLSAFDAGPFATGSGYTFTSTNTAGNAGAFREDYFIRLRIAMNANQQNPIYPIRSRWYYFKPLINDLGQAYIEQDIGRLVEELMEENDLWPVDDENFATVFFDARKFYVSIQEFYSDSLGTSPYLNTSVVRALRGGREVFARTFNIPGHFNEKFITNRRIVYTDRRLPDWCYFIEPAVGTTNKIVMFVDVVDEEGAPHFFTKFTIPKVEQGRIVKVPCGYDQLELTTPIPAKKYSIRIEELTATNEFVRSIAKGLTFVLLPESDYVSGLQYYNSFGLLESVLLNGSIEAVVEWSRSFENVDLPIEPKIENHNEIAYEVEKQLIFSCTTGPISKESWSAANDILLSKKHYWVDVVGKRIRHAVKLEKGKSSIPAFNPDGVSTVQMPLKIAFPSSKTSSTANGILDL
jgi:hypothetical protein